MNVQDWADQASKQTLHHALLLMGSISAGIIILALTAAFFPIWISEKTYALGKRLGRASKGKSQTEYRRWPWKLFNRASSEEKDDDDETDEETDRESDGEEDKEQPEDMDPDE